MSTLREKKIKELTPSKKKNPLKRRYLTSKNLILVGVALVTALIMTPSLYERKVHYKVGDIARKDIKAPYDLTIPDRAATQKRITEALNSALPLFDYDPEQGRELSEKISAAFSQGKGEKLSPQERFEKIAAFLGVKVSPEIKNYVKSDNDLLQIELKLKKLVTEVYRHMIVEDKERILKTYKNGIQLRILGKNGVVSVKNIERDALEKSVDIKNIKAFLDKLARKLLPETPQGLRKILVEIVSQLISPNVTFNKQATNEKLEKIKKGVKTVFYKVKKGEVIVREGERINREQLLIINYFNKNRSRARGWLYFLSIFFVDLILLIVLYTFFKIVRAHRVRVRNKDLLFLATVIVISLLGIKLGEVIAGAVHEAVPDIPSRAVLFSIPLAAATMVVRLTLGSLISFLVLIYLAINGGFIVNQDLIFLVYFFVTGLMGIYGTHIYNSRKEIMRSGFNIGLLAAVFSIVANLFHPDILTFGESIVFAIFSGILSAILTLGLIPLFEYLFGYVTPLTLLELANIEHPLLKEMLFKAQGSYHHSLIVGNLAEVAAESIGANPLLAKVQAYFHDVGKILKPEYFIENQAGGVNPHDNLNPYMSAKIIISHVKDGVLLAKQYNLPQVIIDAIQQHHGTSLIKYFYEKAKETAEDPERVDENDFRYPGPKPQTKEIGIIMLADAVEAASRTLVDPSLGRVQYLIDKIVNRIIEDGQLDETDLTFRDIKKIKESFLRVLSGAFHHRIDYPGVELNKPVETSENGKDRGSKSAETH